MRGDLLFEIHIPKNHIYIRRCDHFNIAHFDNHHVGRDLSKSGCRGRQGRYDGGDIGVGVP
jgi:hypothetical protein